MTVRRVRRRRLLRASWFTSAGEGSWMTREQVRFVELAMWLPPKRLAA